MVLICTLRKYSSLVWSKLGVSSPAVSISSILRPLYSILERIASRVVCDTSEVTSLSYPRISLMMVDLPTLGLPIMQILMMPLSLRFLASAPLLLEKPYSGRSRNY